MHAQVTCDVPPGKHGPNQIDGIPRKLGLPQEHRVRQHSYARIDLSQVYSCILEADCIGLKKSGSVSNVIFQTFVG